MLCRALYNLNTIINYFARNILVLPSPWPEFPSKIPLVVQGSETPITNKQTRYFLVYNSQHKKRTHSSLPTKEFFFALTAKATMSDSDSEHVMNYELRKVASN